LERRAPKARRVMVPRQLVARALLASLTLREVTVSLHWHVGGGGGANWPPATPSIPAAAGLPPASQTQPELLVPQLARLLQSQEWWPRRE